MVDRMVATETLPRTPSVQELLDAELAFSPSFMGRFSNHLAMALVALHQLGAPPAVLRSVFDAHAAGHSELRDDWDLLEPRLQEVARDGIAATVRARVPELVTYPASQLFHPVIRLGYALDVGHEGQVAAALLDWERRGHVLATPKTAPGSRRLPDVAAELARRSTGSWEHTFDLDSIARHPDMWSALNGVALDEHTLDDVSSFAIAAHTAADDFITLHLVTGARAVRTVSDWVDAGTARRLAAHTLPAMAIAYAAAGAPPLLSPDAADAVRRSSLPTRTTSQGARSATATLMSSNWPTSRSSRRRGPAISCTGTTPLERSGSSPEGDSSESTS